MTSEEKERIKILRKEGYGYIRIGKMLNISANTVRSFCKRHDVAAGAPISKAATPGHFCQCCCVAVEQTPGRKEKKFCSDKCRMKWWNGHLDKVNKKAFRELACPACKQTFLVYGARTRKYCSHECYIADRFGGTVNG